MDVLPHMPRIAPDFTATVSFGNTFSVLLDRPGASRAAMGSVGYDNLGAIG